VTPFFLHFTGKPITAASAMWEKADIEAKARVDRMNRSEASK